MSSTNQQLKEAFELIKNGQKERATALLLPILRADKDNADAWWLMANALDDPDEIREALENVLRLRPDNVKAQAKLDKLNQQYPPKRKNDDDEFRFDDDDDDFLIVDDDDAPLAGSRRPVVKKEKGGTNVLTIILAVIGGLVLVSCIGCALFFAVTAGSVGQAVSEVFNDPTFVAGFDEIIQSATIIAGSQFNQRLSPDVRMRGEVERGQTVRETVGTTIDDGWQLRGNAGETFTIEVRARDDVLDPQLFVYNPDETLLDYNDDIDFGTNTNSRLTIILPVDGVYTLVIRAFAGGGAYELVVR